MTAAVEVYKDQAAMVSLREIPWHGLGTVIDEPVSTAEMLTLAHLDNWNVRLVDLAEALPDFAFIGNPALTVRDNPFIEGQVDAFGVVGERYNEFQNEELFDFGDHILDGGGRWETAGSLKGGRVVFGALRLTEDLQVGDELHESYLMVTTSHDGSLAIQASDTIVRPVCWNTVSYALQTAARTYKFRHTSTAKGRIQSAREALGVADRFAKAYAADANELLALTITDQQFVDIIQQILPAPDDDAAQQALSRWENKFDAIIDTWNGPTIEGVGVRNTGFGAYNAIDEVLVSWKQTVRAGNVESRLMGSSGLNAVDNATRSNIRQAVLAAA